MKKIPGIFPRNVRKGGNYNTATVSPGVDWVFRGEGIATQKFDGTACAIIGGALYKRYDYKKSSQKLPTGAIPCQESADTKTGHWPHWIPVNHGSPEDWIHTEAWNLNGDTLEDGTYELCGPKVNGNPENLEDHRLIKHGSVVLTDVPLKLEQLRKYLKNADIEGIVFHHPDGRMAKITKVGFGMQRR